MSRKIAYWASTAVLCLLYLASATFYVTQSGRVAQLLGQLGYPGYLVLVLVVAKLAGVAAVLSRWRVGLSDLAYAGMLYHLLLALSAHLATRDLAGAPPAVVGLVVLAVSWLTQNTARATPSPYAPSPSRRNAV